MAGIGQDLGCVSCLKQAPCIPRDWSSCRLGDLQLVSFSISLFLLEKTYDLTIRVVPFATHCDPAERLRAHSCLRMRPWYNSGQRFRCCQVVSLCQVKVRRGVSTLSLNVSVCVCLSKLGCLYSPLFSLLFWFFSFLFSFFSLFFSFSPRDSQHLASEYAQY